MRYSDVELFDMEEHELNIIKENLSFNKFCIWACERLQYLISESTKQSNWIKNDISHLRNYRIKSVKFYKNKRGTNV